MAFTFRKSYVWGSVLVGLSAGTLVPLVTTTLNPVIAASDTANFPDTQNYWAQPFIQSLAERNVVTGYPDGTYRPTQAVDRDEFAAIVRDAFDQKQERQIASGSVYKDVPKDYWAAPAIESAYEMGFMRGYPGEYFRPRQPVTKVEAISSLAKNLNLKSSPQSPQSVGAPSSTNQASAPPVRRQAMRRRPIMFPIAMTVLMQPLVNRPAIANVASTGQPTANAPAEANKPTTQSASAIVSEYYVDAGEIPQYAVDDVAAATRAGIVVNHPDLRVLNPNQPATRGEIAALIHQALVSQGRVTQIADQSAAQYVVNQR